MFMPCCPCEPDMNWMNTSSRLVSPRSTLMPSILRMSLSAASSFLASEPTTCSVVPNGATWSTPSLPVSASATLSSRGPWMTKVVRCEFFTTSSTVPVASILP